MAKFKISVTQTLQYKSEISNVVITEDECDTITTFTVNIFNSEYKYVTIMTTDDFGSYEGNIGYIIDDQDYTITITGDNKSEPYNLSSVVILVRDDRNGEIENELIINRAHNGVNCP